MPEAPHTTASPAYARTAGRIADGRPVILDGAVGTELPRVGGRPGDERLWGTRALIDTPDLVLDVHRAYVATGCDVLSTNTWGLASALAADGPRLWDDAGAPVHWMDIARRGLRLATSAVDEAGRQGETAVAFSLNADVDSPDGRETIRLLARLFADEPAPPDLVLVETLSVLRPSLFETVEELLNIGLPVWLSFRRCRHGVCGVYGEHWGGPEGDEFGRAARRFEQMGVGALLVNCIPPDHVDGMVSYLRDFSDLPLGVYPNLGYFTDTGWRFDPGVGGSEYAGMALGWREEGAQIVGGCCGTKPEHIVAAREKLEGTRPGHRRRGGLDDPARNGATAAPSEPPAAWSDGRERRLFPLPFPDLAVDPGVQPPDEASFMVWRYLFREGVGAHQRCLDVGCGTGILGVQLALNGASHVRAIDVDRRAVANTLTNAFRNGVDGRLTATVVDLFPWTPEERYEIVVASLHQQPADPAGAVSTHRAVDYWGRQLVDQLIAKLSDALAPEGVAYVMHLSLISQQRTAELLEAAGFRATVVDWSMYGAGPDYVAATEQIHRVEEQSDAYHLNVGERDVLVAYLLEITAKGNGNGRAPIASPPRAR
jgi:S-methylmethionine-dependent homocysteine/selenocysteine methylase/SAM-dependent methyltransferase